MQRWNHYWFRPYPYIDLGMVRIITVATQLFLLLRFRGDTAPHILVKIEQFVSLPDAMYIPITIQRLLMLPFGWGARPSLDVLTDIYYVTVLAGVLALIGLATRISLLAFALGNIFLVSYLYSFGDYHHTEAPLFIAFGILALGPAGHALSVDAVLRRRRQSVGPQGRMAGWPILLIQWLFVLIYLSGVLSKLVLHGGLDWLNGYTLQYYLIGDSLRHGTLLGLWFSQHHLLVMISQYIVIAIQGTFVLTVIYPKLRWIYVPMAIGFHIANSVFLGAHFPQWIALLTAVFIPWRHVFDMVGRHWTTRASGDRAVA